MADSSGATTLGSWTTDGSFATTASRYSGIGFDADLDDKTRFIVGVVRLLRCRKAEVEAQGVLDDPDMTIFLLHPAPPDRAPDAIHVPMVDNGLTPVIGRLWFTSAPVLFGPLCQPAGG